jgi:putative SOS response-associated peptidase YedK
VIADGFYEWRKAGKTKQPYFIHLKDHRPFGFAGLWERWGDVESCTIVTTEPNELCATLHDRMPVIIPPTDYDEWLDSTTTDTGRLQGLLTPFPVDEMAADAVDTRVNSVHNDDARCIQPPVQQELF